MLSNSKNLKVKKKLNDALNAKWWTILKMLK